MVQTDAEGGYTLSIDAETILFMTKPAGYMVPVNEVMLPQFYYLHQPGGSPGELEYEGVAPTGPLPASVDFPVHEHDEPSQFDTLLFADPQPYDDQELDYVRDDVVAEVLDTDALFGLTVGDIVGDDLSLYPRYNQIIASIGIPFWNVPGNHDLNFDVPGDRHSLETYKRVFGPPYYSFDYGDAHFVVLDNVEYYGEEEGGYRGYLSDTQLQWLRNDLSFVPDDKLLVLAMHIPLILQGREEQEPVNTLNREQLFEILAGREHLLALSGHIHTVTEHTYFGAEDGLSTPEPLHHIVLTTLSGLWWGGPEDARGIPIADTRDGLPNGYHVLTVEGNSYRERFKGAGHPEDYQMRIAVAQPEAAGNQLSAARWQVPQLVVNVFNGDERTEVAYRIGEGDFAEMTHTPRADPYTEALYARYPEEAAEPVATSHTWTARLNELEPGVHRVEVQVTDQYGQVHEGAQLVEVTAD